MSEGERPSVPSPIENRARQRRRTQPAGTPIARQPAPRQTPPPASPTTQFANLFLGGMPPRSPAPDTPQTYTPMERVVDRRRTMAEAQSQAQQARERQILAQLAPSNPSNPSNILQMGGASDFGVSRRFQQSPDSELLVPPPRVSRVQLPPPLPPPSRAVQQSLSPLQLPPSAVDMLANRMSMLSPYRSPEGVFNFEDELDYKSSSSGSGMRGGRLARYYKK